MTLKVFLHSSLVEWLRKLIFYRFVSRICQVQLLVCWVFFFKKSVWSNCFNHANLKNRFWPGNLKTKKFYRVVLQSNLVIEKGFKGLYHSVFPNIVTAENVKRAIIPSHYKWVRTSVSILEKMVKWRSGKNQLHIQEKNWQI